MLSEIRPCVTCGTTKKLPDSERCQQCFRTPDISAHAIETILARLAAEQRYARALELGQRSAPYGLW